MDRREDIPGAIDTIGEYVTFTTILLAFGLAIGGVGMYWLWITHPTLDLQIQSVFEDEEPRFSGGEIRFTHGQVADLNKTVTERLEEYGYCMKVDGHRVAELRHPLRDHNSTPTHIVTECPGESNGHLHTHPLPGATAELSYTDKKALARYFEVSCIIAGPVLPSESVNPDGLKCYENPLQGRTFASEEEFLEAVNQTEFKQVRVRIQE